MMKTRLRAAQKGHSLLKKKADALNMRFRSILGKIVEVSLLQVFPSLWQLAFCNSAKGEGSFLICYSCFGLFFSFDAY